MSNDQELVALLHQHLNDAREDLVFFAIRSLGIKAEDLAMKTKPNFEYFIYEELTYKNQIVGIVKASAIIGSVPKLIIERYYTLSRDSEGGAGDE